MKKFNSYFIGQLILGILIFGIAFTILGRVLTALLLQQTDYSISVVAYPVVLIASVMNAVCMVTAIVTAQQNARKKDCIETPMNPKQYYLIVAAVLTVINILCSVLGFSGTCQTISQNINTLDALMKIQENSASASAEELANQLAGKIRSAAMTAVLLGNVLQAAILFGFTPMHIQRHERIFSA